MEELQLEPAIRMRPMQAISIDIDTQHQVHISCTSGKYTCSPKLELKYRAMFNCTLALVEIH